VKGVSARLARDGEVAGWYAEVRRDNGRLIELIGPHDDGFTAMRRGEQAMRRYRLPKWAKDERDALIACAYKLDEIIHSGSCIVAPHHAEEARTFLAAVGIGTEQGGTP
jgi:hypothetical protein